MCDVSFVLVSSECTNIEPELQNQFQNMSPTMAAQQQKKQKDYFVASSSVSTIGDLFEKRLDVESDAMGGAFNRGPSEASFYETENYTLDMLRSQSNVTLSARHCFFLCCCELSITLKNWLYMDFFLR